MNIYKIEDNSITEVIGLSKFFVDMCACRTMNFNSSCATCDFCGANERSESGYPYPQIRLECGDGVPLHFYQHGIENVTVYGKSDGFNPLQVVTFDYNVRHFIVTMVTPEEVDTLFKDVEVSYNENPYIFIVGNHPKAIAKIAVGSVFTGGFLGQDTCSVHIKPTTKAEAKRVMAEHPYVNYMGHADTATVLDLNMNRINIQVYPGAICYWAQWTGGRLGEGATTVPNLDDFDIRKLVVTQYML